MVVSKKALVERLLPLVLTMGVIILDQTTKYVIVKNWPITEDSSGILINDVFDNDVLKIIHIRNRAIAFSLGTNVPDSIKPALFSFLPLLVLLLLIGYYVKSNEWTRTQRWALAGIFGGGLGNIIDRIYPHGGIRGVVDFISIKFWGIFGLARWPAFNIADATVVVCVIFLFITMLIPAKKSKGNV
ncbi:MAG: signal peptidase II [Spirochaetaceae bacterium]|jgi:signal peptidase II|nr:signal peptidase II [Spirochaetaceae bacterium]